MKKMIPIIKIVGNQCNLRCRYCFYSSEDQISRQVMNDDLLEKFIREYLKLFNGKLIFIWHGGEPLLAGLSFFRKIIYFQEKYLSDNQTIQNNIQTNATLINDKWAIFFKKHNFRVGVSLDGNKDCHNRFRVDNAGDGSFAKTMRGINILKNHDIQPGIIQTLTKSNIKFTKDNFNFFVEELCLKGWGTNVFCDINGINQVIANQSVSNKDLVKFIKTIVNLWLKRDDFNLKIREIENFISAILGKSAPNCTFNGLCTMYFCLESDGKVYPCDRLSNDFKYLFGDFSRQSLNEILNNDARFSYVTAVNSKHTDCVCCEWYNACHNGCSSQRINGVDGKYYYCEARKTIFKYLKEKVGLFKRR